MMATAPSFQRQLTPSFIADALGIPPTSNAAQRAAKTYREPLSAVVTDSRKIVAGCLFVALKGDKFDGHEFIPQALEQGARAIICRRGTHVEPRQDLQVFHVEDTLEAYRKLGSKWRHEFPVPVVVVAGSVGKTTTKELLAACLRGRWPEVLRTQGSQNGFVGIPMTLLEMRSQHGAAVVEVGIDDIGAMEKHMALVGATASVLTSIGPEHLEHLIDVPTVAREEGIALTAVAAGGGTIAINLDDPWIRPHAKSIRSGTQLGYTMKDANGATLSGKVVENGGQLEVAGQGPKKERYPLPLPGAHNAGNLLAAIAVATGLGLKPDEIRAGLKTFQVIEGRSELRKLPGPTPVVCDYYNASPPSTGAGLELLSEIAKGRARWACLGDMLELGPEEETFHRGLADPLLRLGVEHVLLYGRRMRWLLDELKARGFKGTSAHFETHESLATALLEGAKPGDAILIKGSRGMRMEEVWKAFSPKAERRWGKAR